MRAVLMDWMRDESWGESRGESWDERTVELKDWTRGLN
jgi:hypothetical protein